MLQMWSVSPVYSLLPVICEVSVSVTNSFMAPIVAVAATICFTQLFCCQILFGCRKLNELKEREDGAAVPMLQYITQFAGPLAQGVLDPP